MNKIEFVTLTEQKLATVINSLMKSIAFLSIILLFTSCNIDSIKGSNTIITKNYELNEFTSIDVSNTFQLELIQSDDFKIVLKCNDNVAQYVDVFVEDGCLFAKLKPHHSFSNLQLELTVHAPAISKIEASGASSVTIEDYKTENLSFDFSGASDFDGKVNVKNQLNIEASGASKFDIRGKAKNSLLDFSGASELSGKKLIISDELIIDSSGASSLKVTANGTLEIDASGASNIIYYGDGTITNSDISGVSSVEKK
ncbi:MAG: DUF2807 domain-containing protein [Fluviicola sp.]|nr:DUF2807 domain-containing protein [Fluviicola sp.]